MKKSTLLSLTTGLVAVSFSFSAFAESCSVGVACGGNNGYKYYKAQPRTIDMSGFKKGEWVRCVTTDAVDAKNIALGITGAQPSGVKFRYMPSDSGTFASKKGAPYYIQLESGADSATVELSVGYMKNFDHRDKILFPFTCEKADAKPSGHILEKSF